MIWRLGLATLLSLLPLPLSSVAALAATEAPAEEGEWGMTARHSFVLEAGVRVPAAAPAPLAARFALPSSPVAAPPAEEASLWPVVGPPLSKPPTLRLALLGKLLLDGG